MKILLGQIPLLVIFALNLAVIITAGFFYWRNNDNVARLINRLIYVALALKILTASFFTWSQWYVWHLARPEFLTMTLSPDLKLLGLYKIFAFLKTVNGGYFIFYAFGRFWLSVLLTVFVALIWWGALKVISKRRPEAIAKDELPLALVTALVLGWPGVLLYIPATFVFMIIGVVYLKVRKIESRLPIGWAMIAASAVMFVLGTYLVDFIGLGVLKV